MKQQVVVIHGGNIFDSYDDYVRDLKKKKIDLKRLAFKGWKSRLAKKLGRKFDVVPLPMPNAQNAKYLEWKIWFKNNLRFFRPDTIFVGHSLGGIFLSKFLSEERYPKSIKATLLVAAPFLTRKKYKKADFVLIAPLKRFAEQSDTIILYQSKDDKIVPISDVKKYQKGLPQALVRIFKNKGHFHTEKFPEIVRDIKDL